MSEDYPSAVNVTASEAVWQSTDTLHSIDSELQSLYSHLLG
jgi:hypothetical protein